MELDDNRKVELDEPLSEQDFEGVARGRASRCPRCGRKRPPVAMFLLW